MGLLGELPLEDVVQLRAVCRVLHVDAEPYAIAVAFGMTRTRIGDSSMTLSRWREIWGECASAVMSQGQALGAMLLNGSRGECCMGWIPTFWK